MLHRGKALSSPEIARTSDYRHGHGDVPTNHQDISFEGIAANVKLLLKLIHEQSLMNNIEQDDRRTQRMAVMITILDDVKSRIQKYSTPVRKEFRRCNTDLKPHRVPRDKKSVSDADVVIDEKEKLRREIQASCAARKSLEAMCCSLGKEKEIMASELSRKVQELNGMEELIDDLKAQNATLLSKLQACAAEHRDNTKDHQAQAIVNAATLQDRNKALSEQLLKSLDGYRSLKRKYKDTQEENVRLKTTTEEMGVEVAQGLGRIHGLKQQLATKEVVKDDIEKEISSLECMFQSLNMKISKQIQKKSTED